MSAIVDEAVRQDDERFDSGYAAALADAERVCRDVHRGDPAWLEGSAWDGGPLVGANYSQVRRVTDACAKAIAALKETP